MARYRIETHEANKNNVGRFLSATSYMNESDALEHMDEIRSRLTTQNVPFVSDAIGIWTDGFVEILAQEPNATATWSES